MARKRRGAGRFGAPPPRGGGSRTTVPLKKALRLTPRPNSGGTVATNSGDDVIRSWSSMMTGRAGTKITPGFTKNLQAKGARRRTLGTRGVGSS